MAWALPTTSAADAERVLGRDCGSRVHAIEYDWVERLLHVRLFAYRLPADRFRPFGTPAERVAAVSRRDCAGGGREHGRGEVVAHAVLDRHSEESAVLG
jgi:hypothetical protein